MRAVSAASPLLPGGSEPAPSRMTTLKVVTAAGLGSTISVTPFLSVLTAGVGNCTAGWAPGFGGVRRNASGSGGRVGTRAVSFAGFVAAVGAADAQAQPRAASNAQARGERLMAPPGRRARAGGRVRAR